MMTRRRAREAAVRLIFAQASSKCEPDELVDDYFEPEHLATLADEEGVVSETPGRSELEYIKRLVALAAEHRTELDEVVRRFARGWRPERISRTAMAVLRCALTEIMYLNDPEVSPQVAINEAVELAKTFEDEATVSFINGVLGGYMRAGAGEDAGGEGAE